MTLHISAEYERPPIESTDAHGPVTVTVRNDGDETEQEVYLVPIKPLRFPYEQTGYAPIRNLEPGQSTTVTVLVHFSTSPDDAPEEPEFVAV